MIVYVARRVALAALVVAGVIILTFVIAHLVPGDPACDIEDQPVGLRLYTKTTFAYAGFGTNPVNEVRIAYW